MHVLRLGSWMSPELCQPLIWVGLANVHVAVLCPRECLTSAA